MKTSIEIKQYVEYFLKDNSSSDNSPGNDSGKPMIFRPLRVLGFWVGESYFLLSIVVETVRDSFPRAIRGV